MKYNRIRAALLAADRTNNWLSEQLGVSVNTVSRWATNTSQPHLETLFEIARLLHVQPAELVAELPDDSSGDTPN